MPSAEGRSPRGRAHAAPQGSNEQEYLPLTLPRRSCSAPLLDIGEIRRQRHSLPDRGPDLFDRAALRGLAASGGVRHGLSHLDDELPIGLQLVRCLGFERGLRRPQRLEGLVLDLVRRRGEAETRASYVRELAYELTRAALLRGDDVLAQRARLLQRVEVA